MRGLSIALVIALSGCATTGGIDCRNADKVRAVANTTLQALNKFCPIKPPPPAPESEASNVLHL